MLDLACLKNKKGYMMIEYALLMAFALVFLGLTYMDEPIGDLARKETSHAVINADAYRHAGVVSRSSESSTSEWDSGGDNDYINARHINSYMNAETYVSLLQAGAREKLTNDPGSAAVYGKLDQSNVQVLARAENGTKSPINGAVVETDSDLADGYYLYAVYHSSTANYFIQGSNETARSNIETMLKETYGEGKVSDVYITSIIGIGQGTVGATTGNSMIYPIGFSYRFKLSSGTQADESKGDIKSGNYYYNYYIYTNSGFASKYKYNPSGNARNLGLGSWVKIQ